MTKNEVIHQQPEMSTRGKLLPSRASKEKVNIKSYNDSITSRRIRDRAQYDNYLKIKKETPTATRVLKLSEYYRRTYFNERTGKRTELTNIIQLSLPPATVDPPVNTTPPNNGSNYQPVSIIYRRLIFEDNNVIDEASVLSASEDEEIDDEGEANEQQPQQEGITEERQKLRDRLEKENDLAHFVSGTYDNRAVGIALPHDRRNIADVDDYMLDAYEELKDIAEFDCRNKTHIFYYMEGFKRSLRSDKREKLLTLAPEGLLMFAVVLKEMCIRLLEQGEQHVVHRLRTYRSIHYARQFAYDRPYQREELNLMRAFKRYPDIFSDDSDMADFVKGMIRGDKYVRHILDIEERTHSFWLTC